MQRYFIKNKDMLLEESDIRHIKKVMRMNINDKIEVVYNNKLHICEITSLEPFNIKVIEKLDEDKKKKNRTYSSGSPSKRTKDGFNITKIN